MNEQLSSSYINLKEYFEACYARDTDNTHYEQFLDYMETASSIKQLFKYYNIVLRKLFQLDNGNEADFYDLWYYCYSSEGNDYKLKCLNGFLNENIVRLFKNQEDKDALAYQYIVNLRNTFNYESSFLYIVNHSKVVKEELDSIISSKKTLEEAYNYMSPSEKETNGYKEHKRNYLSAIKALLNKGFILSSKELSFEEANSIMYFASKKEFLSIICCCLIIAPFVIIIFHLISEKLFS